MGWIRAGTAAARQSADEQYGFAHVSVGNGAPDSNVVPILNVRVSAIDMNTAIASFASWIGQAQSRYVCVADVHSVMLTRTNSMHRASLANADMITPDGMPLVWVSRLFGSRSTRRVCGPDLLSQVCAHSETAGWRHYFYGGAPGVAEEMVTTLLEKYPRLNVVGYQSPPFRPLTGEEDAAMVSDINAAEPDIVWVGLGCPKQEKWMFDHVHRIHNATLIGVGAAFDFHSGRVKRAPLWAQRAGLEWMFRLLSEPRRLWRRYLVLAPRFATLVFFQILSKTIRRTA